MAHTELCARRISPASLHNDVHRNISFRPRPVTARRSLPRASKCRAEAGPERDLALPVAQTNEQNVPVVPVKFPLAEELAMRDEDRGKGDATGGLEAEAVFGLG